MVKRLLIGVVFSVSLFVPTAHLGISTPALAAANASCGVVPVKPVPPVGCNDLSPVCTCDEHGRNCRWSWVCVKSR